MVLNDPKVETKYITYVVQKIHRKPPGLPDSLRDIRNGRDGQSIRNRDHDYQVGRW